MKALIELAESIAGSVAIELRSAESLENTRFFTEASLRVGRAVEAVLYAYASALKMELLDREITELAGLVKTIRETQAKIIRTKNCDDVRSLSNVSKRLSEAISKLSEDADKRVGTPADSPKRSEQLFREIRTYLKDTGYSENFNKLAPHEQMLRGLQEIRNRAAHASLDGDVSEIEEEEYRTFAEDASGFIMNMLQQIIGMEATVIT
jgi:hypothetical protein